MTLILILMMHSIKSKTESNMVDINIEQHHNFQTMPIYDSGLLEQQTEFISHIKNTINIKHNLAEIDLLKLKRDLKNPNLAYL